MAKVTTKVMRIGGRFDTSERPPVSMPLSDAIDLVAQDKARFVTCKVVITGNVTPYNAGDEVGYPYHEARQLVEDQVARPHPDDAAMLGYADPVPDAPEPKKPEPAEAVADVAAKEDKPEPVKDPSKKRGRRGRR